MTGLGKRGFWTLALGAALWGVLLLWASFEVLDLYSWTRRREDESDSHFKGRLESISAQAHLIATGLFVGAAGVGAISLALLYSKRLEDLREELAAQRGRRLEVEEMGLAAAGLAHETKNPLGLMRGMAQRIASGPLPPEELKKLATNVIEQADLTSSRLSDFLRYAGVKEPSFQTLDAKELLSKMAVLLESDFTAAKVSLELSFDSLKIEADPEMLSQTLVNLLLNALKFTPAGGKVKLSLKKERAGKAALIVSDTGKGIASELLPQIFKPYFSKRAGGCGLGLAIAKRMAERSGWEISVESEEGSGASFIVRGIKAREAGNAV